MKHDIYLRPGNCKYQFLKSKSEAWDIFVTWLVLNNFSLTENKGHNV